MISRYRLPIVLAADDTAVLVIGGGRLAYRKCRRLLDAGARLRVVAHSPSDALQSLIDMHTLEHLDRSWTAEDLDGQHLVIAATGIGEIDQAVATEARSRGQFVNIAADPESSDFLLPSVIDRDPLLISVSSGGSSPILARLLAARIAAFVPETWRELASLAARYRDTVAERIASSDLRRRFWETQLSGRVGNLILQGRNRDAEAALLHATRDTPPSAQAGEVYLVGAGPGEPDLLTFRALRLMQQADVVLYDRLVSPAIMDLVNPEAERLYVGKRRSEHAVAQTSINELLVEHALAGRRVLRLKGGDPFIFGRGGEEIATLSQHDIAFQVVPGITAAAGCASYAGIPLTHRDHAQSCLFVTGQLKNGTVDLDWPALVRKQQTVVVYMGLVGIEVICRELIAHGMPEDTPIALIAEGTMAEQRVLTGVLSDFPATVAANAVQPPTLIIIGDVVRLRSTLAWFDADEPT